MATPEKLCIFCEHGSFDLSGMGGEYPDPAGFVCNKRHRLRRRDAFNGYDSNTFFDENDYRQLIMTALQCPDYSEVVVMPPPALPTKKKRS